MNLAQYRLKATAQNRNRLWLCLAAAGMLHVGAIALTHPLAHYTSPDLIQFIVIDQPDSLPTASNIRANSTSRSVQTSHQAMSTFTGATRSRSSLTASHLAASQSKTPPQAISTAKPATAKDEVWGAYLTMLRQRIYQQWQATPLVSDRPTKVRFVVDRQGHLTDLELIQSSSDATADQDAIKAVQAAAPFAHLPIASKEDQLRVTFTFEAPVFP